MPQVYPFQPLQYSTGPDVSAFVAPPYDVLDGPGKAALLAPPRGDPRNIVAVDLPHTPAKELGPAEVYAGAAARLSQLVRDGTLIRAPRPAMFAYRQTFSSADGDLVFRRCGMACCVETAPLGRAPGQRTGILPHEETFSGPKADRLALMIATRTQLSPIFGLHADEHGKARAMLARICDSGKPDLAATTDDGTLHEVWKVEDAGTIAAYQAALSEEDIFIADGHHRYTTAVNYLEQLKASGSVPTGARRCMFVLVGMSDPGLVIWPTHRVLGGMKDYSIDAFLAAARDELCISEVRGGLTDLTHEMSAVTVPPPPLPRNVIGLHDFASGRCFVASFRQPRPLGEAFADRPRAWQELDVALVQHVVVDRICRPRLNAGDPVTWAFPHTLAEVREIGRGGETGAGGGRGFAQLAVIVRPTPLDAVRAVSAAGHLMPQKSTFFYPKLATGLFMHPLD